MIKHRMAGWELRSNQWEAKASRREVTCVRGKEDFKGKNLFEKKEEKE
jgi:hypothetical protein